MRGSVFESVAVNTILVAGSNEGTLGVSRHMGVPSRGRFRRSIT